jgi:CubicO group peptidase (beta-lactamase class C family)
LLGAGASGMVSTVADMTRFISALRDGELLPPNRFKQMLQDGESENGLRYGLGIFSYHQPGVGTVIGHNGGLLSNSQMFYLSDGTIVVALKNGFDRNQSDNNQLLYTQAFQAIRKTVAQP